METDKEKEFENFIKQKGAGKHDFRIPENYFEKLQVNISNKLPSNKTISNKWIAGVSFAACLIITALLGYQEFTKPDLPTLATVNITSEEILSISDDLNEEIVFEAFANETSNINSPEVGEYLIENHVEANDLIHELN